MAFKVSLKLHFRSAYPKFHELVYFSKTSSNPLILSSSILYRLPVLSTQVAKRISVQQRPDSEQIELASIEVLKSKLYERGRNPRQSTVLSANLFSHKQISNPIS